MVNKKKLGQYFTTKNTWLKSQIKDFIQNSGCTIAYDPYAGNGDLIKISHEYGIDNYVGLDIDTSLSWEINDSLKNIPHIKNAIIITNPPYLTIYSAVRKHIEKGLEDYFKKHTDLYQLAIEKILEAQDYAVAIVPETYINSTYINKYKERLHSITILLNNPFNDTENPVCVVCFDNNNNKTRKTLIFIEEKQVNTLENLNKQRLIPKNNLKIEFNVPTGKLAIRAVDLTTTNHKIEFMNVNKLQYNLQNIKNSSRLITVVDVEKISNIDTLADKCNKILYDFREKTNSLILSPFKGNAKDGTRRRRLDYRTARAIIEKAIIEMKKGEKNDIKL